MRSAKATIQEPGPIAVGGGRFATFLAGSAGFGSLVIALLVALVDLEDESDDRRASGRGPADEPARPSSSRRPSRRG